MTSRELPSPIDPATADRVAWRLDGLLGGREGRSAPRDGDGTAGPAEEVAGRWRPGSSSPPAVPVRRALHRLHLVVIGLVLVVGLALAGWAVLRARAVMVSVPLTVSTPATAAPDRLGPGEPTLRPDRADGRAGAESSPLLVVHVLGAVRDPGLVRVPTDARVQDAIRAAGGLRRDADHDQLNLAQVLGDGQQVVIGTRANPRGEVRDGGVPAPNGGSPATNGRGANPVDLNRATAAELDALPGVGPVTAERILAWRNTHGRFTRVAELQEVDGIGPRTYARLAPHVRV